MDSWVKKVDWIRYCSVRVARCAKKDKMAPAKWQNWYNGKWSEPGIGGHSTDVFNWGGTETVNVFYSTYLKKYCALISGGNGGKDFSADPDLFYAACNDLNVQDWTQPVKIASAGTNGYYNWAVDKQTCSRNSINGTSFRYYTNGPTHVPKWYDVKFADLPAGFKNEVLPAVYPPESINHLK